MSYLHRIGKSTVSNVIRETCNQLWLCLKNVVLRQPTQQQWLKIANDFEQQWQFPNCIGALDGKHVVILAPPHSGSSFYNYKGAHSIVLMAICDANYRFVLVDVGAQGRQSDGGIFRSSAMGRKFYENKMDLPKPRIIVPNLPKLPYVLVGDEAFQLTKFLMRLYPGRNIERDNNIFNYRLSRARRTIENAFGILTAKWRIFTKPINTSLETTEKIILATICLHNYLIGRENNLPGHLQTYCPLTFINREDEHGSIVQGEWRRQVNPLPSICNAGTNSNSRSAAVIRNAFKHYMVNEGAVPWQWNRDSF